MLLRLMRGLTRENLAEMAHITPKFLYEVETGKKGLSVWVLYNLCQALNVNSDYLLMGSQSAEYDQKLMAVLKLFGEQRTEQITKILLAIYELL